MGPDESSQVMQCINCGYVSSSQYTGTKKTNKAYKNLTDDMKKWSVEKNNRIWIPTILTLPIGMLYPYDKDGKMKWFFAPMVEIPEDQRENYPSEKGGFYERKIDTDNPTIYEKFIDGMSVVNQLLKNKNNEA